MKDEIFNKGIAILTLCFPSLDLSAERVMLMRELLDHLEEEIFVAAIKEMGKYHKEVYSNTNLIAHIIERAEEIKKIQYCYPPLRLELPMSEEERNKNLAFAKQEIQKLSEKLGWNR